MRTLRQTTQGFLLNKEFCSDANPFVEFDGTWKRVRDFDIRNYVNPYWSEVFNPSYYTSWRWKMVKPIILKKYCTVNEASQINARMRNYRENAIKSRSLEYILSLEEAGENSRSFRSGSRTGLLSVLVLKQI